MQWQQQAITANCILAANVCFDFDLSNMTKKNRFSP